MVRTTFFAHCTLLSVHVGFKSTCEIRLEGDDFFLRTAAPGKSRRSRKRALRNPDLTLAHRLCAGLAAFHPLHWLRNRLHASRGHVLEFVLFVLAIVDRHVRAQLSGSTRNVLRRIQKVEICARSLDVLVRAAQPCVLFFCGWVSLIDVGGGVPVPFPAPARRRSEKQSHPRDSK